MSSLISTKGNVTVREKRNETWWHSFFMQVLHCVPCLSRDASPSILSKRSSLVGRPAFSVRFLEQSALYVASDEMAGNSDFYDSLSKKAAALFTKSTSR